MRSLRLAGLSVFLLLFPQSIPHASATADAVAGDPCLDTVVSVDQFSSIFLESWWFPFLTISERPLACPAKYEWWTDFSAMPKALVAEFINAYVVKDGIRHLPLMLTLNVDTGQVSVQTESGETLLSLPKPAGFDAAAKYEGIFRACYPFVCWGDDADACRKALQPRRLVLQVWLTDVNDLADYEKKLLDQETAVMSASEAAPSSDSSEGAEALAVYEVDSCGGVPVTAISQVATNIRLNWVSITNDAYAVQYADNMEWFNTWHLIGDNITSATSNAVWDDVGVLSNTNVPKRFYRVVRKDASYGIPCVTILSPTNGAALSGNVNVQVYATDDSRISSITLFIDGSELMAITDGPMSFTLPTAFFTNGIHTLTAVAVDDGLDEGQGIASNSVNITFQNNIMFTWYEAFGSVLPIQAVLSYSNADYTVEITDESLNPVRTITGSTANGIISTNWDGKSGSGVDVPEDALYYLTLIATPTGSLLDTASDTVAAGSFREKTWGTEVTIIAREKFSSISWDSVSSSKCTAIAQYISESCCSEPAHQDIYLGVPQVLSVASHWQNLLLAFKVSPARNTQFYFTGHANATAIGEGPGLEADTGMQTIDVELALQNHYYVSGKTGLPVASFKWPYKFVFIDGCLSGNGDWMRAFGILNNTMNYSTVGRKNRAFLGWGKIQVEWLFSTTNGYTKFGTEFWNAWTSDDTRTLEDAIQRALAAATGVDANKLVIRGYDQLQWSN